MTPDSHRGSDILHDPRTNKGTAFTEAERETLGLRGLLPPRVFSQAQQESRILESFRGKSSPLEQYIYLSGLLDRNERLFYRSVVDNIEEMMPVIYTPTVGEACRRFGAIFRRARGLYVSIEDRGRVAAVLRNWPEREVRIIVVTDGERILGLGDLGAHGMGIPIGKLSLYTACAGVDPSHCLPVTLDVGTEREELLNDPMYLGLQRHRARGAEYEALVEEFVNAVQEVFPGCLIQFEDFATENAIRLLARYRDRVCSFNDDIQGTAAVTLAGLYSSGRLSGRRLTEERVLFLGAGSAATGIADLVVGAMGHEGLAEAEARKRCWFIDSKGLVIRSRTDLADHKKPYAHDHPPAADLLAAVESLKPTALIGVSAQPNTFTEPVVRAMASAHERPVIFPLSNPTSKSECSAEQAWRWTEGRAIFASGSPFPVHSMGGNTLVPGQANNAYIFPGLGLGVLAVRARRVTDAMFHAAARALAVQVSPESLAHGTLFPPLPTIRKVSAGVAVAVAEVAYDAGLAALKRPADLRGFIEATMYQPGY
jgi:malate dehydrogenase (oxaloacetate-decarboxylating)(NADP+)